MKKYIKSISFLVVILLSILLLTSCGNNSKELLKDVADNFTVVKEVSDNFSLSTKRDNVEIEWLISSGRVELGQKSDNKQEFIVERFKVNQEAVLTAIFKSGGETLTRDFEIIIIASENDEEVLNKAISQVFVNDLIRSDFSLHTQINNVSISWDVDSEYIKLGEIKDNKQTFKVFPDIKDNDVTLDAIFTYKDVTVNKSFKTTIIGDGITLTDRNKVVLAIDEIKIYDFIENNFNLKTKINEVTISWQVYSENVTLGDIVNDEQEFIVNRTSDAEIIMIDGTFRLNSVTIPIKYLTVVVAEGKNAPSEEDIIQMAMDEVYIDDVATDDFLLPKELFNVLITWELSGEGITLVENYDHYLALVDVTEREQSVILEATFKYKEVIKTKTYVVTIEGQKIVNQFDPSWSIDNSIDTTIKFAHTRGQNQLLTNQINSFKAEMKDKFGWELYIQEEQMGSYNNLFDTISHQLTVGDEPNLAFAYPDHVASYLRSGKVLSLDSLMNYSLYKYSLEELNDFPASFLQEGREYDDLNTTYSMPFSKSTEVLFYNKTFFEANNLKVPETWDEIREVSEKIKTIMGPSWDGTPFAYDAEDNLFITRTKQIGSDYTQINKDTLVGEAIFNTTANH